MSLRETALRGTGCIRAVMCVACLRGTVRLNAWGRRLCKHLRSTTQALRTIPSTPASPLLPMVANRARAWGCDPPARAPLHPGESVPAGPCRSALCGQPVAEPDRDGVIIESETAAALPACFCQPRRLGTPRGMPWRSTAVAVGQSASAAGDRNGHWGGRCLGSPLASFGVVLMSAVALAAPFLARLTEAAYLVTPGPPMMAANEHIRGLVAANGSASLLRTKARVEDLQSAAQVPAAAGFAAALLVAALAISGSGLVKLRVRRA